MDVETLYFTTLSTTLAWLTVPLYPLCLVMCCTEPPEKTEKFPPPRGTANRQKPRDVSIPLFPTKHELLGLLLTLLADLVFLCPYLPESETKPVFSQYWGFPLFAYQGLRALCLVDMDRNWVAAQERQGLWRFALWKIYYLVHIFLGAAVGLPLLFRFAAYTAAGMYHGVPIAFSALRMAYGLLS